MEKIIRILQDKHDSFIGNRKDEIKSSKADGFKSGLLWAIDTIKTIRDQEELAEQHRIEFESELRFRSNQYGM